MAKIPFWKRWWSYLFEIHIESAPSEFNPHLYVSLRNGRYQLSTANAIYSYGDLYNNFVRAFERIKLDENARLNVLILGFGLGSIPLILEKKFHRDYYYTAVELDENVIYLADKYVMETINSPVQTICADAYAYVLQTQEQFDLICMDVFWDDVVPENFESIEFLEGLKDLLNEDGILLYNRLSLTEKDHKKTSEFYQHQFLNVFEKGTYLDVEGNWILVNDKRFC